MMKTDRAVTVMLHLWLYGSLALVVGWPWPLNTPALVLGLLSAGVLSYRHHHAPRKDTHDHDQSPPSPSDG